MSEPREHPRAIQVPMGDMSDDELMNFTKGTRKSFLRYILREGFPDDPKDQSTLLSAMNDMDRTALGNKRIGANDRMAAADVMVAKTIAMISESFTGSNPFERENQGQVPAIEMSLLPDADIAPGETDIGVSTESYKDFVKKFDE